MTGELIVLEGIDGAGKSTLANLLAERSGGALTSPKETIANHLYVTEVMAKMSGIIWPKEELKAQGKIVKVTKLPSVVNIKRKSIKF